MSRASGSVDEEAVGLVVAGEGQAVGRCGHGRHGSATPGRLATLRTMSERTLIRTAHLLDVEGGAWLAERRILVAADGRIEAILGPDEPAPDDARPIDLGDAWVIPGLIDCHSHLVGDLEYAGVAGGDDLRRPGGDDRRPQRPGDAGGRLHHRARCRLVPRLRGLALRDAIDAGWTPGPADAVRGRLRHDPGGAGDVTGLAATSCFPNDLRFGVVRTPAEVRERVRAVVGGGADLIKILVTGAVLTRGTRPASSRWMRR